jgi:hypothetical protein
MNNFEEELTHPSQENRTLSEIERETKEHPREKEESPENRRETKMEEAFAEAQEQFGQESEAVLQNMRSASKSVAKTNEKLAGDADAIPGEAGDKLRERIRALQEKVSQTWSRWSRDTAAFAKVALLAGAPVFLPQYDAVEADKSVRGYEQTDKKEETFEEMRDRAKRELSEQGITSEQKNAYIPLISKTLQRGIEPIVDFSKSDIGNIADKVVEFVPNLVRGKKYDESVYESQMKEMMQSEDAFALYLGLPQQHETFGISDYQPAMSKEKKYYFKLNGYFGNSPEEQKKRIHQLLFSIDMNSSPENPNKASLFENHTLTNHTISKGEDEKGHYISYYDRWDFEYPMEGKQGFFGKPFEVYDRMYYDPKTFEPIPDKSERSIGSDNGRGK